MLECNIAICKLGPGETIWMTPSAQHGACSRWVLFCRPTCFRTSKQEEDLSWEQLGYWATDEICPKFEKKDEEGKWMGPSDELLWIYHDLQFLCLIDFWNKYVGKILFLNPP
jgi:hypothetical protein